VAPALMFSLNPQRSYRIKILKLSQTGELFFYLRIGKFILEMMDHLKGFWLIKSRVFILFILITLAWRLNTTLQVNYFDQRLFSNIRAFIGSKYNTNVFEREGLLHREIFFSTI